MAKILLFFRKAMLVSVGAILSLVIMFTGGLQAANPPEPENADTLISQISVLADVHMETFETFRYRGFAGCLRGLPSEKNTLVLLGDNTMNGQITEYLVLYGLMNRYGPKDAVVAPGNHDVRINFMSGGDATICEGNKRSNDYYGAYLNEVVAKPYYSRKITGATLIVLASEQEVEGVGDYMSAEQLAWLEEALTEAAAEPVFVFSHDPLPGTFGQSFYDSAQAAAIRGFMQAHGGAYFLSGHVHASVPNVTVLEEGGVRYVNVPALMSNESPTTTGFGFQIELYPDSVLLRLRDFENGEWIEGKEFRF